MPRSLAVVALLAVTAVWGWTFVVVQQAVAVYGVLAFLAVRFAIAAGATGLVWGGRLDRRSLVTGGAIGGVLAVGYVLQTWGLRHTTATNAGLITGLFVIVAPIADRVLYRTRLRARSWLAAGLSLLGLALLTGRAPTSLGLGDGLVLGCALAFGVHIALLSRHAPRHDPRALSTAQMIAAAGLFLALWPFFEPLRPPPREVWFALVATGLLASAVAYVVQTAAQRRLSAVHTALILTTEPVFAGVFGYLLAGERLMPVQLAGAGIILAAVTLNEVVGALQGQGNSSGP